MKSKISLCVGLLICFGFVALTTKTSQITIRDGSHFFIKGTSNVNSFTCYYQKLVTPQRINVSYRAHNTGWLLENAKISFQSNAFDCGGRRINNDFKELIRAKDFNLVEIEVCEVQFKGNYLEATIQVTIAGEVQFLPIQVAVDKEKSTYTSVLRLDINDFNLDAPSKVMGLIKVDNEIAINISLHVDIDA